MKPERLIWKVVVALAALLFWPAASTCFALGGPQLVQIASQPGAFPICDNGAAAVIVADTNDYPGVLIAANNFRRDVESVTGVTPAALATEMAAGAKVLLVGTLGKSRFIESLAAEKKLDISGLAGKWESFVIQVVSNPMPGVEQALVVCGSDKRGTIYGIYELSEQMGVSPWHYWADAPPQLHEQLFVLPGRYFSGPPSVKYRGIFLNDEYPALTRWVQENYGKAPGYLQTANYGRGFYTNLFDLMHRIRANYLWPAMWNNAFNEDDPESPRLADTYGIVMGTSHQEPMLRAQKEWDRGPGKQQGAWDYTKVAQRPALEQFWREGIRRNKDFESIITLGLRAENDSAHEVGKELTEQIVKVQRQILAEEMNSDLSKVPQMWCLYKEVMGYYREGLRVPEDVTLLWAEDNWGNVRRLPTANERHRSGGAGVYYHFDYHGGPRSYQWVNTSPISKVWDQMSLAKQYGAERIWIVNVGHFKGYEFPMEFFMRLAWNTERWGAENLDEYTRLWAQREFGAGHAEEAGRLIKAYTQLNGRRKPELLDASTYSLVNYREYEIVSAEYEALAVRAQKLYDELPSESRDAFYGMVQFPIKACAQLHALYLAAARNALYATQGRACVNDCAADVQALFAAQTNLMAHYNSMYARGKWNHFMDQAHIGYKDWSDPPQNSLGAISLATVKVPQQAGLGVALEGSEEAWPESKAPAVLPAFDVYNQQRRYLEVFNKGGAAFDFNVEVHSPWLIPSQSSGRVEKETRIWFSVDWHKVPQGRSEGTVTLSGAGTNVLVRVQAFNPEEPTRESLQGFVESDGYVSMEGEHYATRTDAGANRWERLSNYGHTLSGMRATGPADVQCEPGKDSPCLEYKMYLFTTGKVEVEAVVGPTLNFIPGRALRYAVAFDDEPPRTVTVVPADFDAKNGNRDWEEMVTNNGRRVKSTHTIERTGYHTLKIWMVDPAVVLEKVVVNTGGVRRSYLGPPESLRAGVL